MSDVTAKESTQETAITLIGLFLGVLITKLVGEDDVVMSWAVFLACTFGHQYANFRLCRVLMFDTFNPQRVFLLAQIPSNASLPNPKQLARREQLFGIPIWLSVYGPIIGAPLSSVDGTYNAEYYAIFREKKYIFGLCSSHTMLNRGLDSRQRVAVCLADDCTPLDQAEAYYAACLYDALVDRGAMHRTSELLFSRFNTSKQPNQASRC